MQSLLIVKKNIKYIFIISIIKIISMSKILVYTTKNIQLVYTLAVHQYQQKQTEN